MTNPVRRWARVWQRAALLIAGVARCAVLVALLITLARVVARAGAADAIDESEDGPSSKAAIVGAMQDLRAKYGDDAVALQGHLLTAAVHSGSISDVAVSVGGFEERTGKRFLTFTVETGIIYDDRDVSAGSQPARVWADIVESSLRKFHALTVPADGVALRIGYAHRAAPDAAAEPHTAVFYVALPDIGELLGDRINGQQLVERSLVLLNGTPLRIVLPSPAPSATGTVTQH